MGRKKNKYDHKAFSASCIANNINAFLRLLYPSPYDPKPVQQIPIIMYNVLHTGAKSNSGIKTGFTKVGYQSIIAERVTVPEK
jgi:hypothetical protein